MFLQGKVAIVTAGGGPGMGRAISLALAKEGANVVVAEIDPARANETAEAVRKLEREALAVPTDVSQKAQVQRMVEQTIKRFGKISILVNHAGVSPSGKHVEEMPEEHFDRAFNVHLKGAFLCSQAVLPHMKREGWGRIVCTASRTAYHPTVLGVADYAAAKAGMIGFSRAMAMEVGRYGVTVNCIAPGLVSGSGMGYRGGINPTPEQRQRQIKNEGQMMEPIREVHPDEIAGAVLYLVGPYSERVTGMVIHVNGGSYMPA